MTINELQFTLNKDPWDLWDSVCNSLPASATSDELVNKFASLYGVNATEVREYFDADIYDTYII